MPGAIRRMNSPPISERKFRNGPRSSRHPGRRWSERPSCPLARADTERSIHVGMIAVVFFQLREERDGLIDGALAVLAHGDGAADIDMGAFCEPSPKIAADLAHAVLHVELLIIVARPCQ